MKGLVQAIGHLALLTLTGGLTLFSAGRGGWSWVLVPLLLIVHGAFYNFRTPYLQEGKVTPFLEGETPVELRP